MPASIGTMSGFRGWDGTRPAQVRAATAHVRPGIDGTTDLFDRYRSPAARIATTKRYASIDAAIADRRLARAMIATSVPVVFPVGSTHQALILDVDSPEEPMLLVDGEYLMRLEWAMRFAIESEAVT